MLGKRLGDYLWKRYLDDIDSMSLDELVAEREKVMKLRCENTTDRVELLDNLVLSGLIIRIGRRTKEKRVSKMGS